MKVIFIKPAPGFAYHTGEAAELSDALAAKLIESGHVKSVEATVEATNTPVIDEGSGPLDVTVLPQDCPARDILINAGLITVEQVLENAEKLQEISGIGAKLQANIVEFLTPQAE